MTEARSKRRVLPLIFIFKSFTKSLLIRCPLIDDKLRHNIVKVAVESRAADEWFRSKL